MNNQEIIRKIDLSKLFNTIKVIKPTIVLEECYNITGGWNHCDQVFQKENVIVLIGNSQYSHILFLDKNGKLWRNKK